jgi:transposase-like protein
MAISHDQPGFQALLKGFRFPRSIILCAVWAYHRFALRLRDVEDPLTGRGVAVRDIWPDADHRAHTGLNHRSEASRRRTRRRDTTN